MSVQRWRDDSKSVSSLMASMTPGQTHQCPLFLKLRGRLTEFERGLHPPPPPPLISWRESGGLGGAGLGPKSGNRWPAVRGKAQATWPVPGRPSPACLPAGLREASRSVCGDREEVTAARKVTWCQHQAEPGDGPAGEKGLSLFPPGSAGRVCGINRQQAASRRRDSGLFIFNSCTWQYHRKKVNNKLARFKSSYILLKGQG